MKVICRCNNVHSLEDRELSDKLKYYIRVSDGSLELELGKEYLVYGVVFWSNIPFLYIFKDGGDDYPKPVPIDFFEVSDARLSRFWLLSCFNEEGEGYSSSLLPELWAKNPYFYERLIEGDEVAEGHFKICRELIESE